MIKNDEYILTYPVAVISINKCVLKIIKWLNNIDSVKYFVCANPHSLEAAFKDLLFDQAIRNADLVVPDGVGIVIASKILGGSIRERITGMDIFLGLSDALNKETAHSYSYFFLGSTEKNLQLITEKMTKDFPNIKIAGIYSPPFRDNFSEEDDRLMINEINRAEAEVLWVGMTAPKQEKWIYKNRGRLNVKFIGAIGAVFDFYTGNVKRSHPFFQQMGLEWLPRLVRQPVRLWRRNFVSNPCFIIRVIAQRISTKN